MNCSLLLSSVVQSGAIVQESQCCRPLHLVFGGYYFPIASKIGADRRVMGIALAIEPLQGWSGFFVCTERFIPLVP